MGFVVAFISDGLAPFLLYDFKSRKTRMINLRKAYLKQPQE